MKSHSFNDRVIVGAAILFGIALGFARAKNYCEPKPAPQPEWHVKVGETDYKVDKNPFETNSTTRRVIAMKDGWVQYARCDWYTNAVRESTFTTWYKPSDRMEATSALCSPAH